MRIVFSGSGLLLPQGEYPEIPSVPIHSAFIISATPSMIGDTPDRESIEDDLSSLTYTCNSKLQTISDILITQCITANIRKLQMYLSSTYNEKLKGFTSANKTINLTKYVKTGVLFDHNDPVRVTQLSIRNSHPVQFPRDYIGFYFELNVQASVTLVCEKSKISTKAAFTKIPVLAFKSENPLKAVNASVINKKILQLITGRSHDIIE